MTFTAEDLIRRMDEFGITHSGVLTHPERAATLAEGAREHDTIAEDVSRWADRLVPWCWGTPRWGGAGVAEVRRCLRSLGFRGLVLDPIQEGFESDEPAVDPLCDLAAETGIAVFVETFLEHRGAEPWRLIALAARHPHVPFIMPHLGGVGLQQNMTGATLAADVGNVYLETSCTKSDPFATFEGPARILGAERILLGSNQPLHHVALNLKKLDLTGLAEEEKMMIRGLNFMRLVGLPPTVPSRQRHQT